MRPIQASRLPFGESSRHIGGDSPPVRQRGRGYPVVRAVIRGLLWLGFVLPGGLRAISYPQVEALFRPLLGQQVTLAPDGRHIAYTEHVRHELQIVIMDVAGPYAKVRLAAAEDIGLTFSKETRPATLRFLRWADANRLVFAPDVEVVPIKGPGGPKYVEPVFAIDADGKNQKLLIDDHDLLGTITDPRTQETKNYSRSSRILGFAGRDRRHLLVEASGLVLRMAPGGADGVQAEPLNVPVVVPTTLFAVDVFTGRTSSRGDEFVTDLLGYDQQGLARISYARPEFSLERTFTLVGKTALRFTEPWLGPLAGHFTTSPRNYFGERAYPLGFDLDPNILYVASNVGRDTFGVYALDLKAQSRTPFAISHPHVDLAALEPHFPAGNLIFDENTGQLAGVRGPGPEPLSIWCDTGLAAMQRRLERNFPERTIEILSWSDDRKTFLFRTTAANEPGRFFVFRATDDLPLEVLSCAPWLKSTEFDPTEHFAFESPQGFQLTGYVTWPRHAKLTPPPAVICFADGLPGEGQAAYDAQAHVLAAMGLVVIRLNHRGVGGFGRRHRNAIQTGLDRVPIEDAMATLDWLGARHPIDRKRVATLGAGFGGYLAVRALQLQPDVFRCAVAFDAPLDPEAWLRPPLTVDLGVSMDFAQETKRAFLAGQENVAPAISVLAHAGTITHPVFLLVGTEQGDAIKIANLRLRGQLAQRGRDVDYVEVNADFAAKLPGARARAYARLEEFFNLHLYNYHVDVGPTREVK